MAFSIVQHQVSASGVTGTPTASLTWSPAPTNGNLLVVALTYRGNATTTESTAQGWIQAGTITNGTTCQTDLWYRVAGAGEGTTGPAFNIAAVLYEVAQAEVSGWTGLTPTLDRTGTATGTAVSTLTVTASATTTAATEFVFGSGGNREGNTAGVTWSASTAGGGATFGADIDTVNPGKNAEGLRDNWATSGGSATSPSLTFNLSSSSNTTLALVLATFKGVVAAAVAGRIIQGVRRGPPVRSGSDFAYGNAVARVSSAQIYAPIFNSGSLVPLFTQGVARRYPPKPSKPQFFTPPVTAVAAGTPPVVTLVHRPQLPPRAKRPQIYMPIPYAVGSGGSTPSRPIRRITPQPPPKRVRPQITQPTVVVVVAGTPPVVTQAHRPQLPPRGKRPQQFTPAYNSGGILPKLTRAVRPRPAPTRPGSRWLAAPLFNSGGLTPGTIRGIARRYPPKPGKPQLFTPPVTVAAVAVTPIISQGHRWPAVRRVFAKLFQPPYNSGGISPTVAQGVRRKPGPTPPSRIRPAPTFNSGGLTPLFTKGVARRYPPKPGRPQVITPPFTVIPPGTQPLVSRGHSWPATTRPGSRIPKQPAYNSGGIRPALTQGVRRKPGPTPPSRIRPAPSYNSGGIYSTHTQGVLRKNLYRALSRMVIPPPAGPTTPTQPILFTIVTRSMGAMAGTRDMAATVVTRTMTGRASTRG